MIAQPTPADRPQAAGRLHGSHPGRFARRFGVEETWPLAGIAGIGLALELGVLWLVHGPLALAAHPQPNAGAAGDEPLAAFLGLNGHGALLFAGGSALATALYLAALTLAWRSHERRGVWLVLGLSGLLALTMLAVYPASSRDLFTNVIDGRMAWVHGLNPMTRSPLAVSADPLFPAVSWQAEPSYYGPVWYLLLALPARLAGTGLLTNLVAYRALLLPFLLGAAIGAARLAGRRGGPRAATVAAVLVGFNPLLLWEIAGNGHNDIVMACFAVWALERADCDDWALAWPLLALSVLSKWVTAPLALLFAVAALRAEQRPLRRHALGLAASVAVAAACLAPFWEGAGTFTPLLTRGADRIAWSPARLLAALLHGGWAPLPWVISAAPENQQARAVALALCAAAGAIVLLRLWTRRDDLLAAAFWAIFAWLLLGALWFFPGYVCTLVVLGAAQAPGRRAALAAVFSIAALCGHLVQGWYGPLFRTWPDAAVIGVFVAIVFVPPALLWAATLAAATYRRRGAGAASGRSND